MLFYYLVDIIISPIMYFKGEDYKLMSDALRLGGLLSSIALYMVILLYSIQIFRTYLPGIISILLILSNYINTPFFETMIPSTFLTNKPYTFDLLMHFLAIYFFSVYIKDRSVKYLFYGIFFSSLSFATGIIDAVILIPIIIYLLYNSIISHEIDYKKIKKAFKFSSYFFSFALISSVPVIAVSSYYFVFVRLRAKAHKTIYESFSSQYVITILASAAFIGIVFLLMGLCIYYLEKKRQKLIDSEQHKINAFMKYYYIINITLLISTVYWAVMFLSNPFFILKPINALLYFQKFVPQKVSFFNIPEGHQLVSESPLLYIKLILETTGLYPGIGILIISIVGIGRIFIENKTQGYIKQSLLLLLSYLAIKFALLILLYHNYQHHVIFSIVIVLFILFGYSINYLIRENKVRYIILFMFFLTLLPILSHRNYNYLYLREQDVIYDVSTWIDKNVPPEKVVVSYDFCLLGRYQNNNIWTIYINKTKHNPSPDYIVVTNDTFKRISMYESNPLLSKDINELLTSLKNDYSMIKIFNNRAYPYNGVENAFIYKRKSSSNS